MIKENNYIVVAKQIENGKFQLRFPDFEGIVAIAETEETIASVATNTIKNKLAELKKADLEIKEPLKISEISSSLKEGEFTIFISISNFNLKNLKNLPNKDELKDNAKELGGKVNNFIKSDVKGKVPTGKENILGITAGVISIINTLLFSLINIKIPFFGSYSIGFFRGISQFSSYAKELKTASIILTFTGILLIVMAAGLIYSSIIKNKTYIKYITFSKLGLLVILYIYIFIKIPNEINSYVSVSFLKILLYAVSLVLAYFASVLIQETEKQEGE